MKSVSMKSVVFNQLVEKQISSSLTFDEMEVEVGPYSGQQNIGLYPGHSHFSPTYPSRQQTAPNLGHVTVV